jgi:ABC-type transport system involved in Fe-S cluster assembly fused permease/ATPase subunit
MLERGARSVAMIFRAIVFTFLPTAVELAGAAALLPAFCHHRLVLECIDKGLT